MAVCFEFFWQGVAFVESVVAVSACVGIFVVVCVLDCFDLFSVVDFSVVMHGAAV